MKKIIAILAILLTPLAAKDLTLEWDDPNTEGTIESYNIYLENSDNEFVKVGSSKSKEFIFENVTTGTKRVKVEAVSKEGIVGELSDPFTFTVPNKPGNLRIKVTVQANINGDSWTDLAVNYLPLTTP